MGRAEREWEFFHLPDRQGLASIVKHSMERVHLYFVGKPGIKIAFHVGKNKYQPTMKGKKNERENYRTIVRHFQAGF